MIHVGDGKAESLDKARFDFGEQIWTLIHENLIMNRSFGFRAELRVDERQGNWIHWSPSTSGAEAEVESVAPDSEGAN